MKRQIQLFIRAKKIEAGMAAILSLIMVLVGLYMFFLTKDIDFDSELQFGITQKFFIQNGTLTAGGLGFILSFIQYKAARKIESSEQS